MYCHVEDGTIDRGPAALPRSWKNISGLNHMDAEGLRGIGWLPVRYVDPAFDPETQVRTGPVLVVDTDEVVGTYTVRDKTAQELDDEKDAEATGLLNNRALKAYILCVNDGSIVPGSNMTAAQLKAAIKAKM